MKRIAYIISDFGIDGREKEHIVFASFNEKTRDNFFDNSPSKNWFTKKEIIVDIAKKKKETLCQLDGLEKLVLGLTD